MPTTPESHLKEEKKFVFTVLRVTSMGPWARSFGQNILEMGACDTGGCRVGRRGTGKDQGPGRTFKGVPSPPARPHLSVSKTSPNSATTWAPSVQHMGLPGTLHT